MKIELSEVQVKSLTQMLVNYFNGKLSIAAEAGAIQEIVNVINPKSVTQAPPEVTETESDGTKEE